MRHVAYVLHTFGGILLGLRDLHGGESLVQRH